MGAEVFSFAVGCPAVRTQVGEYLWQTLCSWSPPRSQQFWHTMSSQQQITGMGQAGGSLALSCWQPKFQPNSSFLVPPELSMLSLWEPRDTNGVSYPQCKQWRWLVTISGFHWKWLSPGQGPQRGCGSRKSGTWLHHLVIWTKTERWKRYAKYYDLYFTNGDPEWRESEQFVSSSHRNLQQN